ncbi:hypothetical protein J4429_02325 [Candidatus Pacearchaeota archaeon]|nr:hypothetical protein [Candidatus Pacearchaeota archaeon]
MGNLEKKIGAANQEITEPLVVINLNLPGEESIQEIIDKYKEEFVLLYEDSRILDKLNFPICRIGSQNYNGGIIKSPRKSGFSFETTAPNLKITRVFLDYKNVRELIVTENYSGQNRIVRFIN